jgi:Ca2+/Na+ antiporter
VVGNSIFNLLAVLGFSAALSHAGIDVAGTALVFDIPVMTAVALACLPVFFRRHLIARWEGGVFVLYYALRTRSTWCSRRPRTSGSTTTATRCWASCCRSCCSPS